MKTVCLTLDKRYVYVNEYVVPTLKEHLNLDVEIFLAGDGKTITDRKYDYIDDPYTLPIRFEKSTTYQTWFSTPNAYNAYKCHRAILENFLATPEKYMLMLEDDVYLESDFEEVIGDNLDEFVKVLSFDMMMLGSYGALKRGHLISPNLVELPRESECGGWHALIVNRSVAKRILEIPPYGPMDTICQRYIHGNTFRCLATTPSLITQKSGHSYIEGHHLTKPDRNS